MSERFDIMKFLEEYEKCPCLWNRNHSDYKNRVKREVAEEYLLPISGLSSVKELKQKIRNIKNTYNQEVNRIKSSKANGPSPSNLSKSKLAWFDFADSFLRSNHQDKESDLNQIPNLSRNTNTTPEDCRHSALSKESTPRRDHSSKSGSISKLFLSKKRNLNKGSRLDKSRRFSRYDDLINSAAETLRKVSSQPSLLNEFTIFGLHVASQLQQLPIEEALKLQEKFQSMMTHARLQSIRMQPTFYSYTPSTTLSSNVTTEDSHESQSDSPLPEAKEEIVVTQESVPASNINANDTNTSHNTHYTQKDWLF